VSDCMWIDPFFNFVPMFGWHHHLHILRPSCQDVQLVLSKYPAHGNKLSEATSALLIFIYSLNPSILLSYPGYINCMTSQDPQPMTLHSIKLSSLFVTILLANSC